MCIEIDLSKPLCKSFWLGDDSHRIFEVVLYERLPTFCYACGVIKHSSNSCSRVVMTEADWTSSSLRVSRRLAVDPCQPVDVAIGDMKMNNPHDDPQKPDFIGDHNSPLDFDFGPRCYFLAGAAVPMVVGLYFMLVA